MTRLSHSRLCGGMFRDARASAQRCVSCALASRLVEGVGRVQAPGPHCPVPPGPPCFLTSTRGPGRWAREHPKDQALASAPPPTPPMLLPEGWLSAEQRALPAGGRGWGTGRPCCLRVGRAGLRATSGRFPCATRTVSLPQGTWCLTLSLIKGDTFETKQFLWMATRSQHIPPLHNFLSRGRRCRGARGVPRRWGLLGPPPRRREGGAGRGEKPLRAA